MQYQVAQASRRQVFGELKFREQELMDGRPENKGTRPMSWSSTSRQPGLPETFVQETSRWARSPASRAGERAKGAQSEEDEPKAEGSVL